MKTIIVLIFLILFVFSCGSTSQTSTHQIVEIASKTKKPKKRSKEDIIRLSKIDLSKIGHIAPKGRVQDKDYNQLKVVDDLIDNGKNSIPFLINKTDDKTKIDDHVMDYLGGNSCRRCSFYYFDEFFYVC